MILLLTFLIGVVAGLRAMLAPAAVSWAAAKGLLPLSGHGLAFLGYRWTPWIFTVAALGEFVSDQLPSTPSRKVAPQFGARIVMGGLSGAAIGSPSGQWIIGLVLGVAGAIVGTFGGAAFRSSLASLFGNDHPAAVVEDVVALAGAVAVVMLA
jgi:uncharacterized membrane protein